MQVIKYSGEVEQFNPRKIYRSILEAHGSRHLANEAIAEVKRYYHKNITTEEILNILINFLKREPGVSERYDLKRAIMSLGPSGFPFEIFIANLLKHHGYKTEAGVKLKGKMIYQEVDVVAQRGKKFMIECKYHNEPGIITKLHPAMYTYARFLDLQKYRFDQPWLVTNTKCSHDARKYAEGVNLKITSWNYPKNSSLQILIDEKKLYPITILKSLPDGIKEKLYSSKILITKDLLDYSQKELMRKLNLSEKEVGKIIEQVRVISNL